MNQDKNSTPPIKGAAPAIPKTPPLFRRIDWMSFAVTTLLVFIGYYLTLAPDLTLEDSGELAVGSFYAGVPHPPGYPVWTIYSWLFTVLVPVSNIAWRVALSSAVAGAFACGLIALMTSRGCSMILESIGQLKGIERKKENWLCLVCGFVAGLALAFNGFFWSQAVIVEVYTLSVLSFAAVLCFLLRWMYAPHQRRYLYWAFFLFGISFTNHQTLIVAAMGIEVAIILAHPKVGRDILLWNVLGFLAGLIINVPAKSAPGAPINPLFSIFVIIGIASIASCFWLVIKTRGLLTEWKTALIVAAVWILGAAFYFYMPVASMTNPPLNWGYPRTAEGFMHAFTRGQYEKTHPTDSLGRLTDQIVMYTEGAAEEFNLVYLLIAFVPFFFLRRMQSRERAWIIGLAAIWFFLAALLLILLNPSTDKQSVELTKVFFTSSYVMIAMAIGYGLAILGGLLLTQYEKYRKWAMAGAGIASAIALYLLSVRVTEIFSGRTDASGGKLFFYGVNQAVQHGQNWLDIFPGVLLLCLSLAFLLVLVAFPSRFRLGIALVLFSIMPAHLVISHWFENEQRNHRFGYWFGHDMFTPPFGIYPEMARDTVLFGGTDPGRFNPTYMIFCEGFIPPEKRFDPAFDRRDVVLITQNALADGTYLSYIRAHYNRSTQIDPPFFQEFFPKYAPSFLKKPVRNLMEPLDKVFIKLGDNMEKQRRAGSSFFKESDFADLKTLAGKLRDRKDPVSDFLFQNLKAETQTLLSGNDANRLRGALAKDLNTILEKPSPSAADESSEKKNISEEPLYAAERFKEIKLSDHSTKFIAENPQSHTRIRWNRLLLEDAYPKEIAKSQGGVYPDLEIHTPTPNDSQRAFDEYLQDAQRRYQLNQMKPGEDFKIENGKVQVSGQVAVMSINGILTKMIFDANPGNEFYVEESFPLDWMYPYLTPFGIIMKINRQQLPELTQEIVDKDHEFWSKFSDRLVGNWITYETPVKDICEFAERIYLHHDYKGFKGDRKFARDDNAQKAFSKLRSSIGGIYAWRVGNSKSPTEQQRMIKEADFTFKQAFAYCPFSPEAVYRYVNLLLSTSRIDDAIAIVKTCQKLDPYNPQIDNLLSQVEGMKKGAAPARASQSQSSFSEAVKLMQNKQTNEAVQILNQLLANPATDPTALMGIAQLYVQIGMVSGAEMAVQKLVALTPDNAEAWYNLGGLQAAQGKIVATQALQKAFELSDQRMKKDPKAIDLRNHAKTDPNLEPIRKMPEFEKLVGK
ncbi:MAG: DUF2723 domain-containing protein [Verrucomicrobiota bacterium]